MSFVPAFELGLWNAWILVISMLIIFFFDVRATAARESGKSGDFQLTRKEKIIMNAVFLPMIVSFVYAVFFASTTWYSMAVQWATNLSVWNSLHNRCTSEFRC